MKIEIQIPETLNDLTLGKWQKIASLDTEGETYINNVLEIIYGIKDKNINDFKQSDIELMMDSVRNLLIQDPKLETTFEMDGVEYGFVPNLDEVTFGEFIDLDNYSEKEDYHKLMSVLFRPITKKQSGGRYKIKKYKGSKDMSGMPLGIALGAVAFFLTIAQQLTNDTLKSLTEAEVQQWKKLTLTKSGVGTLQSTL